MAHLCDIHRKKSAIDTSTCSNGNQIFRTYSRPGLRSTFKDPLEVCTAKPGTCTCHYFNRMSAEKETNNQPDCTGTSKACKVSFAPCENSCDPNNLCESSELKSKCSSTKSPGHVVLNLSVTFPPNMYDKLQKLK